MAARAAVRDAGRVLEVPYGTVDKIAKLIPEGPGQTLDDCMKPGGELRKMVDSDPVAREIIDLAQPLEGLTRADSIHAAGVVIGAEPLIDVVPLQQKGADQELVTQFAMKDIEALGLQAAGVKLADDGLIEVDGAMRTSAPGVYAIGDLVHGPALAHKASDEGVIAVEDAAGMTTHPIEYIDIPRATFCTPNVASFGLTEAQAREQGYDVVVGKVQYGAVGAGTVYGDRTGLVKIVGDKTYGELLGGHIVGAKATELIQELVNARALEGGYPEIARIIHGHPTLSEAVMEAARAADGWLIHG